MTGQPIHECWFSMADSTYHHHSRFFWICHFSFKHFWLATLCWLTAWGWLRRVLLLKLWTSFDSHLPSIRRDTSFEWGESLRIVDSAIKILTAQVESRQAALQLILGERVNYDEVAWLVKLESCDFQEVYSAWICKNFFTHTACVFG